VNKSEYNYLMVNETPRCVGSDLQGLLVDMDLNMPTIKKYEPPKVEKGSKWKNSAEEVAAINLKRKGIFTNEREVFFTSKSNIEFDSACMNVRKSEEINTSVFETPKSFALWLSEKDQGVVFHTLLEHFVSHPIHYCDILLPYLEAFVESWGGKMIWNEVLKLYDFGEGTEKGLEEFSREKIKDLLKFRYLAKSDYTLVGYRKRSWSDFVQWIGAIEDWDGVFDRLRMFLGNVETEMVMERVGCLGCGVSAEVVKYKIEGVGNVVVKCFFSGSKDFFRERDVYYMLRKHRVPSLNLLLCDEERRRLFFEEEGDLFPRGGIEADLLIDFVRCLENVG
jgi:hypothetical protein